MMEQKLKIIKELMDELVDSMELSSDDLDERLGRKKPEMKIEIESSKEMEDPALEGSEELSGMDLDSDQEMDEDLNHKAMMGSNSPDEDLKKRLMKMKG